MIDFVVQGGVAAALLAGTLLVRRRTTGRLPRLEFWIACLVGVIAVTVGTIVDVSGVLLAVPVAVVAGVAIMRGGWWLGDVGLFLTVLGIGMAAAYVIAAVLDPDTGSFADQGAQALIVLGALVSLAAISLSLVRGRTRGRQGRG